MSEITRSPRAFRKRVGTIVLGAIVATTTLTTGMLIGGGSTLPAMASPAEPTKALSTDTACFKKQFFTDVAAGHQFFDAITGMGCLGYSTGTQSNTGRKFEPKQAVTREAMAAFMYRRGTSARHLEGYPFTPPTVSPFADVKPNDRFYREITWLHHKGITTGTAQAHGKPLFQPKDPISREAVAAFMYRYDYTTGGRREGLTRNWRLPVKSPFTDMAFGSRFCREVTYLGVESMASGYRTEAGSEFRPKENVSREAMAAFIMRMRPLKPGVTL